MGVGGAGWVRQEDCRMRAGPIVHTGLLLQPAWADAVPLPRKVPSCPIPLSPGLTTTRSSAFICKYLPKYASQGYFYINGIVQSVVQLLSHVWLFASSWTAAHQAPLSSIISQSLLKFMSIELVMLFNHLLLCRPLVLLPSIFPSIRVFSNELTLCIKWPKHWTSVSVLVLLMFKVDFVLISLQSEGLSRVFSAPQFKSINSSVLSLLYGPTLTFVQLLEKP